MNQAFWPDLTLISEKNNHSARLLDQDPDFRHLIYRFFYFIFNLFVFEGYSGDWIKESRLISRAWGKKTERNNTQFLLPRQFGDTGNRFCTEKKRSFIYVLKLEQQWLIINSNNWRGILFAVVNCMPVLREHGSTPSVIDVCLNKLTVDNIYFHFDFCAHLALKWLKLPLGLPETQCHGEMLNKRCWCGYGFWDLDQTLVPVLRQCYKNCGFLTDGHLGKLRLTT